MTIRNMMLPLAALILSSAAQAANTKVCFEAEKARTMEAPFRKTKSGEASGGNFVELPWDRNHEILKGKGKVTYTFKAPKAGLYTVWARAYMANGCGNSVGVSVNNGPMAVLEASTMDEWVWVGGKTRVRLKAGANTLVLKNREMGPRVDQFFLCTDPDYEPVGTRKVTQ